MNARFGTRRLAADRGIPTGRLLVRGVAVLATVTAAARFAGFLRTVLLARVLGATTLADAYTALNALPTVVFELVAGGALAGAVVPVLAHVLPPDEAAAVRGRRVSSERDRQTIAALLTWTGLVLTPVVLVLVLTRYWFAALLLGGGPDAVAEVATGAALLAAFAPQVVLYGLASVAVGVLHARRRFLAAALAPLASTAVVASGYAAFAASGSGRGLADVSGRGVAILGVGTTAGVGALCAAVLVPVLCAEPGLRPALHFPPGVAGRVRGLVVGGCAAVAAQQVAVAVSLRLAAGEPGGVLVWTLAWTVLLVPWSVVSLPVVTRAYPELAAAVRAGGAAAGAAYRAVLQPALRLVLGGSVAAAGLLAAGAEPLAQLLLASAPGAGVPSLARALVAVALALPGYAVSALLTRALWAVDEARTATRGVTTGWAVAVVVDLVLVEVAPAGGWRPAALGLGAAAGTSVSALLLARAVRRAAPGVMVQTSGPSAVVPDRLAVCSAPPSPAGEAA